MNLNKLTEKAQEAIVAAQRLAEERHNTQLEPIHLLSALMTQEGGVVPSVLEKLGVVVQSLASQVDAAMAKLENKPLSDSVVAEAAVALASDLEPGADIYSTAATKLHLARVITKRALAALNH